MLFTIDYRTPPSGVGQYKDDLGVYHNVTCDPDPDGLTPGYAETEHWCGTLETPEDVIGFYAFLHLRGIRTVHDTERYDAPVSLEMYFVNWLKGDCDEG